LSDVGLSVATPAPPATVVVPDHMMTPDLTIWLRYVVTNGWAPLMNRLVVETVVAAILVLVELVEVVFVNTPVEGLVLPIGVPLIDPPEIVAFCEVKLLIVPLVAFTKVPEAVTNPNQDVDVPFAKVSDESEAFPAVNVPTVATLAKRFVDDAVPDANMFVDVTLVDVTFVKIPVDGAVTPIGVPLIAPPLIVALAKRAFVAFTVVPLAVAKPNQDVDVPLVKFQFVAEPFVTNKFVEVVFVPVAFVQSKLVVCPLTANRLEAFSVVPLAVAKPNQDVDVPLVKASVVAVTLVENKLVDVTVPNKPVVEDTELAIRFCRFTVQKFAFQRKADDPKDNAASNEGLKLVSTNPETPKFVVVTLVVVTFVDERLVIVACGDVSVDNAARLVPVTLVTTAFTAKTVPDAYTFLHEDVDAPMSPTLLRPVSNAVDDTEPDTSNNASGFNEPPRAIRPFVSMRPTRLLFV